MKPVIEAAMGKVWHLSSKATFREVGANVFIISFKMLADKHRVENGRPWLFNNCMFIIEAFDGIMQPRAMMFDRASLCLQLHQLPLMGMNKKVGEKVGSALGVMEEVEVEEDDVGWGKYLRVRVNLDLTKPLARGRKVTLMGEHYWIPIRYEKIPRVCFACGCIIHDTKTCNSLKAQNGGGNQFGPWMRASWEGR